MYPTFDAKRCLGLDGEFIFPVELNLTQACRITNGLRLDVRVGTRFSVIFCNMQGCIKLLNRSRLYKNLVLQDKSSKDRDAIPLYLQH